MTMSRYNTSPPPTRSPIQKRLACQLAVLVVIVTASGCKSPLHLAFWKPDSSRVSIDGIRGPLQRKAEASVSENSVAQEAENAERLQLYELGQKQFKNAEYELAEKSFKKASGQGFGNVSRLKWKDFWSRDKKDAKNKRRDRLREDAMFMQAESQYMQQRYAYAQDSYVLLMKEFPSTRYLDRSTQRLFDVASTWLGSPSFATTNEIQQVNLEQPKATLPQNVTEKPPHSAILVPNLTDRSRPVFDTPGRALQALKSIWLNDPTGPLADDALMLTASYYFRKGDYQEADRVFSILREEYPKSPHLESAFVLGSHVKLMSYQGAAYDGRQLNDAKILKESTLRLFPNSAEKERIQAELEEFDEANAQRDWQMVEFYRRKRNHKAMAVYCNLILENFSHTKYAEKARKTLAELGPEYANHHWDDSTAGVPDEKSATEDDSIEEPRRLRFDDADVRPGRVSLQ